MRCERCGSENPELAQFCWRCGRSLHHPRDTGGRKDAFAIQPFEHVGQLAVISTLLPHANRAVANEYRWALVGGAAAAVLLATVGMLSAAIMIAAFLLPVTYLVYVHDIDLWGESPGVTFGALYLITAVFAGVISLIFFRAVWDDVFAALLSGNAGREGWSELEIGDVLLFGVALPIVGEVARQIGPIILARQPRFDDMIDGFTFGAASGVAFAAFETVIAFGAVFTIGLRSTDAIASWIVVILSLMVVKPVIYGCATGMAVAAFSGKGEGFDGFTPHYLRQVGIAVAANIALWLGIRILAPAPFGLAAALLWGALIASILIVWTRTVIHTALLEAAVEDAAREFRPRWATTESGYCAECENALLPDSLFCVVCGGSVRAASIPARRLIQASDQPPETAS